MQIHANRFTLCLASLLLQAASTLASVSLVTVPGGTLPSTSFFSGQTVQQFQIGKYEVTRSEWDGVRQFAVSNGYDLSGVGAAFGSNHPVHSVNWYDVLKWLNAKSEQNGLTPVYRANGAVYRTGQTVPTTDPSANGYRLPTEQEWEWAAAGAPSGPDLFVYSGGNQIDNVAIYFSNASGSTQLVGTKFPNQLSLYDMSGNIYEWTWSADVYTFYGNTTRAIRGGSWQYPESLAQVFSRSWTYGSSFGIGSIYINYLDWTISSRTQDIGFRYARNAGGSGGNSAPPIANPPTHPTAPNIRGTVVAWGSNANDQASPPANLNNVAQVSAGATHTLALKSDGTVIAWGDKPQSYHNGANGTTNVPLGLSGIVQVAAGSTYSLALKADGRLVAWGTSHPEQTQAVATLENVDQIAAGASHALALKTDGTVAAWGASPMFYMSPAPGAAVPPVGLTQVVQIAAGFHHSLALKSDGTVAAWGGSEFSGEAKVPEGLSDVTQVAAGGYHSLALKRNGTVVAWGSNMEGQTAVPAGLTDVVQIAGGEYHSLALKRDGTVVGWGAQDSNLQMPINVGQATPPAGLVNVAQISAGARHSVAIVATPTPPPATTPILTSTTEPTNTVATGTKRQKITFQTTPQRKFRANAKFTLTATANSGLPVRFTSDNPAVIEVAGRRAIIRGKGRATITAHQDGNNRFRPARTVSRAIRIK